MLITVKTAVWGKNDILSKMLLRCAAGAVENIFADTRYFYSMLGNDPYLGLQKMFKCISSPNKESSAAGVKVEK